MARETFDQFDLSAMAEQSGAGVQAEEDFERFLDEIDAFGAREGGFLKSLLKMGTSTVVPAILKKFVPGVGIADMLFRGIAGGSITDIFNKLITGDRSAPEFKTTVKGPYATGILRELERKTGRMTKEMKSELKKRDEADTIMAYLSSFGHESEEWKKKLGFKFPEKKSESEKGFFDWGKETLGKYFPKSFYDLYPRVGQGQYPWS